jgi:hypothetical protein
MQGARFHTLVDIPVFPEKTGYRDKNIFMGSCFTENVGARMQALNYPVDINPFGILYNPVSVAQGLEILVDCTSFSEIDLVEHDGLWHSFYHHGRFSSVSREEALEQINSRIKASSGWLREAAYLFVTFGTAWVYRLKSSGQVVANCHKIPEKEFIRERLSVGQIVELYCKLLPRLREINPKLKLVFTVSPIRHWKDGANGNQLSKATLLLAVDTLLKTFPGWCAYFPSYEIVMDELRDYRFYAQDMLHLNEVAIDYIWSVFEASLIGKESQQLSEKVQKIRQAVNHRPMKKDSDDYRKFLDKTLNTTVQLESDYPFLNLKLEKEYFIRQIGDLNKEGDEIS